MTTPQPGHTPIPWEAWRMNDGGYGIGHLYPKDRACVDIVSRKIDSKTDANFIVEACNAYDSLRAENERLREAAEEVISVEDTLATDQAKFLAGFSAHKIGVVKSKRHHIVKLREALSPAPQEGGVR